MRSGMCVRRNVAGLAVLAVSIGCSTESTDARIVDHALYGGCQSVSAGAPWRNDFFTQRTSRFAINLNARPLGSGPIDALIGFGNGPADTFTDLAAIVRFNPSGLIDARDGGTYRSVAPYPYRADGSERYWMSIVIDPETDRYSAWVETSGVPGSGRYVAENFAFRTEQTAIARFDNLARFVDSAEGTLEVCDPYVAWRECLDASSSSGWQSEGITPMTGRFTVSTEIAAYPMNTDAVLGLSRGAPDAFRDLGPIVRVNPNGTIDVRDGSAYRADVIVTREPSQSCYVFMDIDVPAKRYSVWVRPRYGEQPWTLIANNYAFRSEQAAVSQLDTLGAFVDSDDAVFAACNTVVRY